MDISVKIGRLKLKNPVLVSSGTFGYGEEYASLIDTERLGAIVSKTITLKPRKGNSMPRIVETPSGMLNAIGLQNDGFRDFIANKLPKMHSLGTKIIVSILGVEEGEFREMAGELEAQDAVDGIELNLSCPNICSREPAMVSQDEIATAKVVRAARKVTKKTLIAKLSPNVTDITEIAQAAEEAGADAVSLVNTFLGMAIDVDTRRPRLANITGGLSGPAIRPIAVRMVYEAARAIKVPVIGMGGILTALDALEFLIAGAKAISVGTANFVNPKAAVEILDGIEGHLKKNKLCLKDLSLRLT